MVLSTAAMKVAIMQAARIRLRRPETSPGAASWGALFSDIARF
jgi:hypothetical protein